MCQQWSRSVLTSWAGFKISDFHCTEGEIKYYKSSEFAERGFCPECGSSPITDPRPLQKRTRSQGPFLRRHYPASTVLWPCPTPARPAVLTTASGRTVSFWLRLLKKSRNIHFEPELANSPKSVFSLVFDSIEIEFSLVPENCRVWFRNRFFQQPQPGEDQRCPFVHGDCRRRYRPLFPH